MTREILGAYRGQWTWTDCEAPDAAELAKLAETWEIHPTAVADLLARNHLPKAEKTGRHLFLMVRYASTDAGASVTLHGVSDRFSLFLSERGLLTVHRRPAAFLDPIARRYNLADPSKDADFAFPLDPRTLGLRLVADLLNQALLTFDAPLQAELKNADHIEEEVFSPRPSVHIMRRVHHAKRRALAWTRLLALSSEPVDRLLSEIGPSDPWAQDLKENLGRLRELAHELGEATRMLLDHHLALSSLRINRILHVLTVFSVFFLPLTFLVGVYGMNFKFMPELEWKYGYPAVLLFMATLSAGLLFWFRRKRWM